MKVREVRWSIPGRTYVSQQCTLGDVHSFRETLGVPLEVRVVVNEPLGAIHEIYSDPAECILAHHDHATIRGSHYKRAASSRNVRRAVRTTVTARSIERITDIARQNAKHWNHQWMRCEILGISRDRHRATAIVCAVTRWKRRQWRARA